MKTRLLFICAGNTCRSPIAAALTVSDFPDVSAECAGILPGYAVAKRAIVVVAEMTKIDISDHIPRAVSEFDLQQFDRIVAMDRFVADEISSILPPRAILDVWNVPDPYGGSIQDYRRCAATLRTHIRIHKLREDIDRWRKQLLTVGPTHAQGIAAAANVGFENLLKQLIEQRIRMNSCNLSLILRQVGSKSDKRPVDKLTLGLLTELLIKLREYDPEIAEACSSNIRATLRSLPAARNVTIHERSVDEMRTAATRILDLIQRALDHEPLRDLMRSS